MRLASDHMCLDYRLIGLLDVQAGRLAADQVGATIASGCLHTETIVESDLKIRCEKPEVVVRGESDGHCPWTSWFLKHKTISDQS